jgi:hypothetical protein
VGAVGDLALPFALATTLLIVKLFNVVCIARIVSAKCHLDATASLIAAWLLLVALQTAVILALSAAGHLDQFAFVSLWIVGSAVLFSAAYALPRLSLRARLNGWNLVPLLAGALVLGAVWLRSALFFDSTSDGQTYGLPRLILWLHAKSVFIHMDTPQINLFTNEWIAELNMVAYALWSGDYLGFNFGNLELLAVFIATVYWIARLLGIPGVIALVMAVAFVSTPAVIGLATVMKGDLLACVALCIAFGWLLRIKRGEQQPVAFSFLLLSLGLAVSAKISTALVAVLFGVWAVAGVDLKSFRQTYRSWWSVFVVATLATTVLLSRFWTNWWVYGNPVKRVKGEEAAFALQNVVGNADIALRQCFPWKVLWDDSEAWALIASMGMTVWFLLALVATSLVFSVMKRARAGRKTDARRRAWSGCINTGWLVLFALAVVIVTAVAMAMTPPHPWTFRYFLPAVLVVILVCCVPLTGFPRHENLLRIALVALCCVVAANSLAQAKFGEILPVSFEKMTASLKVSDTALKRAAVKLPFTLAVAGVADWRLDAPEGLSIAVYQSINHSLLPFMGSRAQNSISFTRDIDDLIRTASQTSWDAIVISSSSETRPDDIREKLEAAGYRVLSENELYLVALPLRRIEEGPVLEPKDLAWEEKFGATAETELASVDHHPQVHADTPVDAGLVSQLFDNCGPAFIEARIEGEIASLGPHAAHLSLHSIAPLLVFPSGKYRPEQSFHMVAVLPCAPYRLSFGLGGWGNGSGQLRLVDIRIQFFRIKGALSEAADAGRNSVR